MKNEKTYHHGHLKEALIRSGLDILAESGLSGLSLRNCAERTGVSHTAPKNHFSNLTGLLTAIAAEGYIRLKAAMVQNLAPDSGRAARREAAFKGYVDFAMANPALFELMFSKRKINGDDPVLQAPVAACFEVLRDISSGLMWDRASEPDSALRAQMLLWSLVHGFAQLSTSGTFQKEAMRHIDILDVLPRFGD